MAVTYGGIVGKVASTNDCGAYINLSNVKSKSTAYPLNSNIDYKRKNSTSAGGIADIKNSFVDITNTCKSLKENSKGSRQKPAKAGDS